MKPLTKPDLTRRSLFQQLVPFLLLLTALTGRSAPAANVLIEQTDVFVAGQDGVFEYRIPGLVTSTRGTLLAFCDARVNKAGDPPNKINLVLKRSTDAGKTWGALQTLAENGNGAVADSGVWSIGSDHVRPSSSLLMALN